VAAAIAALDTLSVSAASTASAGTCYALAMAGGGDRVAYEAGVLRGLTDSLPENETAYQSVSGISAGSTLTAAFSVYPLGEERAVVDLAYAIIASLDQSAIFRQWPGGAAEGQARSAMLDSTPLRTTLTANLADRELATDRVTCMGVANARTRQFERLCEHTSIADVVSATLASAAIPGVFVSQTINGNTYVDGGTLVPVDVSGAIQSCQRLGYTQSQITVDVIECSSGINISSIAPSPALNTQAINSGGSDFEAAVRDYPDVNFRYRIGPTQPIPGNTMDFDRTSMTFMQQLGEQDARNAVRAGATKTKLK